jgi:hypothetical protein
MERFSLEKIEVLSRGKGLTNMYRGLGWLHTQ